MRAGRYRRRRRRQVNGRVADAPLLKVAVAGAMPAAALESGASRSPETRGDDPSGRTRWPTNMAYVDSILRSPHLAERRAERVAEVLEDDAADVRRQRFAFAASLEAPRERRVDEARRRVAGRFQSCRFGRGVALNHKRRRRRRLLPRTPVARAVEEERLPENLPSRRHVADAVGVGDADLLSIIDGRNRADLDAR